MATLIVQPESEEKLAALKAFMKALKISFKEEKPYSPAFETKIERSKKDFETGKFKAIKTDKEEIINNIKTGLKEVQLLKQGKLKTTAAEDFLNEL
jgi:hypothetical protein